MKQPATIIAALILLLFGATDQGLADDAGDAKKIDRSGGDHAQKLYG